LRLIVFVCFWVLVGCGPKSEPVVAPVEAPSDPSAAADPGTGLVTGSQPAEAPVVSAQLVPLSSPGQYEIRLEWKAEGVFLEEWWVQRVKPSLGSRAMIRLPPATLQYTVTDVPLGVDHEYRVYAHNEGTNAEIGSVSLRPLPDRVFTKGEHIWKAQNYGRLFFEKGALLRIREEPFDVKLLELHSQTGVILSEPVPTRDGFSVQPIRLQVGLARGDIDLITDGQPGPRGIEGVAGAPGVAGKDAFAGRWEGWARADGVQGSTQKEGPRAAERGGVGGDGGEGGVGGPGGDGGAIILLVEQAEKFWPTLSSRGGQGGEGGEGGLPGPGGPGGKGAAAVFGGGREWLAAAEGPPGKAGKRGPRGPDGKEGAQIVKFGDCSFRRN
jgi:hypothetical protein